MDLLAVGGTNGGYHMSASGLRELEREAAYCAYAPVIRMVWPHRTSALPFDKLHAGQARCRNSGGRETPHAKRTDTTIMVVIRPFQGQPVSFLL